MDTTLLRNQGLAANNVSNTRVAGFSVSRTKLEVILQPGSGLLRWLELCPGEVVDAIYGALSGPLGYLDHQLKYTFALDLMCLVNRHVHYAYGQDWYAEPDARPFGVVFYHIDDLTLEYLRLYPPVARVITAPSINPRPCGPVLDLDEVYAYTPIHFERTFSEPKLIRRTIADHADNRLRAEVRRKLRQEAWEAARAAQVASCRRGRRVVEPSTPSPTETTTAMSDSDDDVAFTEVSPAPDWVAGFRRAFKRFQNFGRILAFRKMRLQAGKVEQKQKRRERDEHQRATAKERVKALWKARDKQERQREVASRRERRWFAKNIDWRHLWRGSGEADADVCEETTELQSGFSTTAIAATAALGGVGVGLCMYKLYETLTKVDSAVDSVTALVSRLRAFGRQIQEHLGATLWVVPLVMVVHYYLRGARTLQESVSVMLTTALSVVVGPSIWEQVAEFFRFRQPALQSGGGIDASSFIYAAPKLLVTAMAASLFTGGQRWSYWMFNEMVSKMGNINRASEGWESFLKWLLEGFESCVNYLLERFGQKRIQMFRDQHTPMRQWAEEVTRLVGIVEKGGTLDPQDLDGLVDLIARGHEFRTFYLRSPLHRIVEEVLMRAVTTLMPLAGALNARDNFRVEPSVLILNGRPGIGKTMMAMHLCAAVLLRSGLVEADRGIEGVLKNIWQKGNSEFWNGYCRQDCLVVDDIFQTRIDAKDKENDYMTLIRAASSWAFPLNFADLASKGKIYFGSKFIFGTTNVSSITSEVVQCLNCPDAVLRRINHPYTLRVKREFALPDGMLDYNKFQLEREKIARMTSFDDPMDAYPWHVWEVCRHDFNTGLDSPVWVPLRQVIVQVSDELRSRVNKHGDEKRALGAFVERFKPALQAGRISMSWLGKPLTAFGLGPFVDGLSVSEHIRRCNHEENTMAAAVTRAFGSIGLKQIGLAGAAGLGLYGAFTLLRCALTALWTFFQSTFGPSKIVVHSNRKVTVAEKAFVAPKKLVVEPGLQSSSSVTRDNIYANSYKLYCDLADGTRSAIGQVLFVESNLALVPAHFTAEVHVYLADGRMKPTDKIYLRSCANKEHVLDYSVSDFLAFPRHTFINTEVQFIRFKCLNAHRSIVKNFITEDDLPSLKARPVALDICDIDRNGAWTRDNIRRCPETASVAFRPVAHASGVSLGPSWFYRMATQKGDCGAPLSMVDNRLFGGRTCMGMHVAGDTDLGCGYSCVVTQAMVMKAASILKIVKDEFEEDLTRQGVQLQASHELPFGSSGSFLPLYKVDKGVNIAPRTSFYKTFLHGRMGEYRDSPAPLSPVWRDGVLVYPMENAVKPYGTPLIQYTQPWLEQAMHVAMRPLFEATVDSDRSIYTFEQAVLGIPTRKFRSVPRNTSPGYPYVLNTKSSGKKDFFGSDESYDLSRPEALQLKERVEFMEAQAKKGIRCAVVYMDFLKDELRSPAKVEAVATRLISSAPQDYTLLWRKYFGAFSSEIMHFNQRVGMAPGICTYTDTAALAENLSSKGTKCFDGDFKGFDASQQPCMLDLCLDVVNRWYNDGEENALVRRVLWMDLVHSRHIGGRGFDQSHIYQWNKNIPSGHPFTTIINSMYSLFLLVCAYISVTGDKVGFWSFVSAVTYGDDNVVNVSDAVAEVYNQVTVSEALMREFGLVYTSGDKTGEMVPYKPLSELTFLKRSMRLENNVWLCPLELNSFLFTHYWCSNRKQERAILEDNIENALQELSMHPQERWDEYALALKGCLEYLGKDTRSVFKRSHYQEIVLARIDSWY